MESYSAPSPSSETFMVGFVIVNIVGLKHYTGTISGREMVGLIREPLNTHDPNAIKVLNTKSIQVGYIERSSAAILSPLIDSELIHVEGIVPKPPKDRNPFKLPCQIHIFTSFDLIAVAQAAFEENGLQLIADYDPTFGLSEAVIVKEKNSKKEVRNIDEVFKLVGADEKKDVIRIVEPPKKIITSELFKHQKEGLGWLIHRENSLELPPFWEEKNGVYVNVLTNYQTDERPEPLRGGIFADDMGLGKTLTVLSLIATNRPGSAVPTIEIDDDYLEKFEENGENSSVSGGKKSKGGKSRKAITCSRKKRKLESGNSVVLKGLVGETSSMLGPKSTLIVCPPSVLSTWVTQLEEHTKRGSLKVYLYYGVDRTKVAQELMKFDIVFTTYSTLASEVNSGMSPLKEIEWFRVILDEAHQIKNVEASQSEAVIGLNANRRWAVTGTPIQNGSADLFSLMAFLRFRPFSVKSYWRSLIQRPLEQGQKSGLSRLRALMGTISLRRMKDSQIGNGLPLKTIETCLVELSKEERQQYDRMESAVKNAVEEYIRADCVMQNYSTVLGIILRLRQICNDVALCPLDIMAQLPSSNLGDISNSPELLEKMISMLQDGDDFDCPVCLCPPSETIITCCAHIFCRVCILKILKNLNPRCPICRRPLSEQDLHSVPPQAHDNPDDEKILLSGKPIPSKVSVLLKLLVASREKNPSTKSVVFSQFRKMLILLEEPLKASGFGILRLDGSMTAKKRSQVIKEFGEQGTGRPTVLLASLKAAGTGINLTAASRVYLMEPWWNPAVEEQAIDRVHRIGQQEEVKVVRLIIRNSIEERILDLQENKKKLARGAFEKKGSTQMQISIRDLRTLMRL